MFVGEEGRGRGRKRSGELVGGGEEGGGEEGEGGRRVRW